MRLLKKRKLFVKWGKISDYIKNQFTEMLVCFVLVNVINYNTFTKYADVNENNLAK